MVLLQMVAALRACLGMISPASIGPQPVKPGKCGTMTHDHKRHGITTLFAALNILGGAVERAVPAGLPK